MDKYDIFISYRREGGADTARILCERLTEMGYKVFFDVEELRSGDFNLSLYEVIENCDDFLLVLSKDALDRCDQENDWLRNEVSFALQQNKNIIPVFLRGFSFASELPTDMEALRYKNGMEASIEFFDAFIAKLQDFLHSKPTLLHRIFQNVLFKKTLPFIIALFIICAFCFGIYMIYDRLQPNAFPDTQIEKNITNELLGDSRQTKKTTILFWKMPIRLQI